MTKPIGWEGVFPAVTTQFKPNFALDVDATARVMDRLIADGVSGLIVCGTVGENTSLSRSEKIAVMEAAKNVARSGAGDRRHRRVYDGLRQGRLF
jgi:4-hydroxy-tetrahydrodipicolinate synthase